MPRTNARWGDIDTTNEIVETELRDDLLQKKIDITADSQDHEFEKYDIQSDLAFKHSMNMYVETKNSSLEKKPFLLDINKHYAISRGLNDEQQATVKEILRRKKTTR